MDKVEILIQNGSTVYEPVVQEDVTWETERKGVPGKFIFKVLKDDSINFQEGNPIRFSLGDTKAFYGFVFSKGRTKDKIITVTCYDQLRYFKNKDTYVYKNKTAGDVVTMIAKDFLLNIGTIEYTDYIIPSRVEDNKTLFDIAQNAIDMTLQNKKELYVLYDNFGKICLQNIERLKLGLIIDEETGENYDYESSIDSDTYNQIKLTYDNSDTGKREVYMAKDSSNIEKWGVLQYFDTIDEKTNRGSESKGIIRII